MPTSVNLVTSTVLSRPGLLEYDDGMENDGLIVLPKLPWSRPYIQY